MNFEIKKYNLYSKKIKKNIDIVVIADLHGKIYGLDNSFLSECVNAINPDKVFILGDMISRRRSSYIATLRLFESVAKYDCYFVNGNHEEKIKSINPRLYKSYIHSIKRLGINVLFNSNVILNEYNIAINGLRLPLFSYVKFKKYDYSFLKHRNIFKQLDYMRYNVLLSHNPYVAEKMDFDYDLILSGHTHGGAVRLPVVGGLISPNMCLFPKLDRGYFEINKSKLIISPGLADHFPIPRINNPKWLVHIRIERE